MMKRETAPGRNFGFAIAGIGVLLFIASLIIFAAPLPEKLDTVLVIAWLFVPGVVGGLVYAKMEHNQSFDEHRHLE